MSNTLPFPRIPLAHLYKNTSYRMTSLQELTELDIGIRQESDKSEWCEIREHENSAKKLAMKIEAKQAMMNRTSNAADIQKLQEVIKKLEAEMFTEKFSACMSISTRTRADRCHQNAKYFRKYMLTSRTFHVSDEGEISREKKKSEITALEQILEVPEEDAVVSVYSVED